ncbi:hypothetical protein HRD49_33665 [Corallococcus exiguus]|uniref:hypothetical protein n=1 Tax=Corallococcus TaxID=83461 RepID=UPI000EA3D2E1|nr:MULTISPECIES: hypothetical protein [Corallococcus]NNC19833.1 hypothetical protein [Corallococcus exiguus]NRD54576.1 hypothetical protein [Corallococcus exiguus]NRD66702.1 hypothetical protein [Corallococcus exiguus]RKH24295.1 hypothetical protein D7V77_21155 [Corallococcus sp. CA041A]RUO90054.1 hypothetical protein D7Y11_27030 [Corallococcus sp. AB018]
MAHYKRILIASAVVLGSVAGTASARTVSGWHGKPQLQADGACLGESWTTQTNNCPRTVGLFYPLQVDDSGNYRVTFNAYGASSANNVGCRFFALSRDATQMWSVPVTYLPSFGANVSVALGPVYVPVGGTLNLACDLNQGARVNSVYWYQ